MVRRIFDAFPLGVALVLACERLLTVVSRNLYAQLDVCSTCIFAIPGKDSSAAAAADAAAAAAAAERCMAPIQHDYQLALRSSCPCIHSAAYLRAPRCKDVTSLTFFMALYVDARTARKVRCGGQGGG